MGSSSYFLIEDKLHDKSEYHGWKMSLDLTLEEKEMMDYVQGKIPKPPSNAPAAAKTKYNKAEVKAKMIIRDSIDNHLVAYMSKLKTSKEMYDRVNFNNNDQRNGRSNGKGKRNAGHQGNGRPSKKSRNSRYDESNVVNNKQKEYYLILALPTASPLDTLGNWLIDSGASRHFTGSKEALSNLIEKETNLEIILGDDATYPVKGVGNVTLQLNQGNTIHLQEALYAPNLKKNLVSISTMEDKGFKVAFIDGKKKDEVFTWFRHFKALIENQCKKKIKTSRTDNGIEYKSNEFQYYCREAGIKREATTPYTLEQNGVAERKNCSIVEAICAMLNDQGFLKFLWVEAANTAVYVQNRCPHQVLDSKTPEEMFTGKKPDVSHFRIFGSLVYFHVPKEKRSKLGASGKKGIFVGYSENSKDIEFMWLVKRKLR
eukprot:PITA_33040